jgi:serine protease
MHRRLLVVGCSLAVGLAAWLGVAAATASANPIFLPNMLKEAQTQHQIWENHVFVPVGDLQPPAPPCPENGELPSPFSNCGLPEFPATTLPYPGNMAYWGGNVQVHPHIYLVFWGWGESGAFPANETCTAETITEGKLTATLPCDPDGAGKYTANFLYQMGGTPWEGTTTQYYRTVGSQNQYIANPKHPLAGIWVDDTNSITNLPNTSSSNPPGPTNTYSDLAAEAARAAVHFGVKDRKDANFVIMQPANYSDPNALASGYCAFHDWIIPNVEGGIYNGIKPDNIAYSNIPYQLVIDSGGSNVCGENAVNSGAAGKLDGFSIVVGHESMETVTDPGAEDILGSGTSTTNLGGWYDPFDANENGDKCAWVGENLLTGQGPAEPVPGAMGDIKGNRGQTFAVQSLWSNDAAEGAGYCAGAGTDLPQP